MAEVNNPTNATFEITDTNLYVSAVTLSTKDDNKLLEQLKTGFKKTIKWNKYRSEMTSQTKTNNLNYLIDSTFTKVNRFVLLFENEDDKSIIHRCWNKIFFDAPIKNKEETYEMIIEMIKNNGCTNGNLLNYDYFLNHYKLIAIDLSKQVNLENSDLK